MSKESDVKVFFDKVEVVFGVINIVVNFVGIVFGNYFIFVNIIIDEWDKVYFVNIKGVFFVFKEVVIWIFFGSDGWIVNIIILVVFILLLNYVVYVFSKVVVEIFILILVKEF